MPQNPQASKCVYSRAQFWRAGQLLGVPPPLGTCGKELFKRWRAVCRQARCLGRAGFVRRAELSVQTVKHVVCTVIGAQPQNPAPGVFDHALGLPSSTVNSVTC